MKDTLRVDPLPGLEPEIGRWMWALEETRRRTLRAVEGVGQDVVDWQGSDGRDNAIGSLLYHVALVEMSWLYYDVSLREFPDDVAALFPHEMATDGRITPVLGVPLDEHLKRLRACRARFLDAFAGMSLDEWRRLREPPGDDYVLTPEWAVFHLVEHEAAHAAQVLATRRRAERALSR